MILNYSLFYNKDALKKILQYECIESDFIIKIAL